MMRHLRSRSYAGIFEITNAILEPRQRAKHTSFPEGAVKFLEHWGLKYFPASTRRLPEYTIGLRRLHQLLCTVSILSSLNGTHVLFSSSSSLKATSMSYRGFRYGWRGASDSLLFPLPDQKPLCIHF